MTLAPKWEAPSPRGSLCAEIRRTLRTNRGFRRSSCRSRLSRSRSTASASSAAATIAAVLVRAAPAESRRYTVLGRRDKTREGYADSARNLYRNARRMLLSGRREIDSRETVVSSQWQIKLAAVLPFVIEAALLRSRASSSRETTTRQIRNPVERLGDSSTAHRA